MNRTVPGTSKQEMGRKVSRIFSWAAAASALAVPGAALALKGLPMEIDHLVPRSERVFVGTVEESSPGIVKIRVKEILKGCCPGRIDLGEIREWKAPPKTLPKGAGILFFLTKTGDSYRIVGTDRFLDGVRDAKECIVKEIWTAADKNGLRLSLFCPESKIHAGKACWFLLQALDATWKGRILDADPARSLNGSSMTFVDPKVGAA